MKSKASHEVERQIRRFVLSPIDQLCPPTVSLPGSPLVDPAGCSRIELFETNAQLTRPVRREDPNAALTPTESDNRLFWLPDETQTQFLVLWDELEIGQCTFDLRRCTVFVPRN